MRRFFAAVALVPAVAWAGTTVDIGSIVVNSQTMHDVHCDLTQGGLFASMAVAAEIASQKEAFDACAPGGAAVTLSWTWSGGTTHDVAVIESTQPSADACLQAAMGTVQSRQAGTCRATLLVGDLRTAEEVYGRMGGVQPEPELPAPTPTAKPQDTK